MKRNVVSRFLALVVVGFFALTTVGCSPAQIMRAASVVGAGGAGAAIGHGDGRLGLFLIIASTIAGFIASDMDRRDQERMAMAYNSSPSGQVTQWVNPDSGNQFAVTPWQAFTPGPSAPREAQGYQTCREAQVEAVIGGQRKTTYTTACLDAAGGWKVVASR